MEVPSDRAFTDPPTDLSDRSFPREWVIMGLLASLTVVGAMAGIGRLFAGLAASTRLSDTYPWGIWIGFDFTLIAVVRRRFYDGLCGACPASP